MAIVIPCLLLLGQETNPRVTGQDYQISHTCAVLLPFLLKVKVKGHKTAKRPNPTKTTRGVASTLPRPGYINFSHFYWRMMIGPLQKAFDSGIRIMGRNLFQIWGFDKRVNITDLRYKNQIWNMPVIFALIY